MPRRSQPIHFGLFLMPAGHHQAAWRHPDSPARLVGNLQHVVDLAQMAERACFDMLFLADNQGGQINAANVASRRADPNSAIFEPITLLSALATHTRHIGLVATATTTYYPPFLLARMFASLDLISGGRAGWNLVTSANVGEAANFGQDVHPDAAQRYARAEEFVDVVKGLWQSWGDDAFLTDKLTGNYFDPDKVHILEHVGQHFSVAGPLHVARSPQGHPVIVEAGSSEAGLRLAARTAEIVFAAQATLEGAQALYADLKSRLPRYGRAPNSLKIMPGLMPVVGATEAEAKAKYEELDQLVLPETARTILAQMFQAPELLDHPLDAELPAWLDSRVSWSRAKLLVEIARREKLTLQQVFRRFSAGRGHHLVIGSPEQIADKIEEWFDGFGADGFNVLPPAMPS